MKHLHNEKLKDDHDNADKEKYVVVRIEVLNQLTESSFVLLTSLSPGNAKLYNFHN